MFLKPEMFALTDIIRKTRIDLNQSENDEYLISQLITYLGNKRSLLPFIGSAVDSVRSKLNKEKLITADLFSGSGVVSRYLRQYSSKMFVNDIEHYAYYISQCYLRNTEDWQEDLIKEMVSEWKDTVMSNLDGGGITRFYSPEDDLNIKQGERVFYTRKNAMILDTAIRYHFDICLKYTQRSKELYKMYHPEATDGWLYLNKNEYTMYPSYLVAPLLSEASIHCNTSGVFKGFYKGRDGKGKFGGEGEFALSRILGEIELNVPVKSSFNVPTMIFNGDINLLVKNKLNYANNGSPIDLVYLDPPYNQHPYGSNYFMLNLLCEPTTNLPSQKYHEFSRVSGIPTNWNRSSYNMRNKANDTLFDLIKNLNAKFILISYNSEGFIKYDDFISTLMNLGELSVFEKEYNTFRGCRNLKNRNIHTKEYLVLLEK